MQLIIWKIIIIMQYNDRSYSARKTTEYQEQLDFCRQQNIKWLHYSPKLNATENLWWHSVATSLRAKTPMSKQMICSRQNNEWIIWNYIRGDPEMIIFYGPAFSPSYFIKESHNPYWPIPLLVFNSVNLVSIYSMLVTVSIYDNQYIKQLRTYFLFTHE